MKPLPDRLCKSPRILFVGINPSLRSAELRHHYAGKGNPFWRLLSASGLVPCPLTHQEDALVVQWGLALTNLVDRPTRTAEEVTAEEYVQGQTRLRRLIRRVQPSVVAFVGITVYRRVMGASAPGGCGPRPEVLHGARVFVLPNPSGRNAAYPGFNDKLQWFVQLARWLDES